MSEAPHVEPGRRLPGPRRPLLRTLIGEALRRHRQGQRRTLADVARHARVSVPYLSEVERGRKEASSEVLAAVCGALRVELADLLAEVRHDLVKDRAPVLSLAAARRRRADVRDAEAGRHRRVGGPARPVVAPARPVVAPARPVVADPRRRPADPVLLAA